MLLEKYMKRIYVCLRLLGISTNIEYSSKTLRELIINHWNLCIQQFMFNLCTIQQLIWLIILIVSGDNLLQITYLIPCVTFCMLGGFRIAFLICNINHFIAVIDILKKFDTQMDLNDKITKINFKRLKYIINLMLFLATLAVLAFGIGPLIMIYWYYYNMGVIKLFLPFVIWYPFDMYDIRFWPIAYIHEMWAAAVAVLSVYGPDCFFFTSCTFIHMHFRYLYRDIKRIVKDDSLLHNYDKFKKKIVSLVDRHRELIRIVQLVEIVYSKSTLFNVLTGSLIICVTGFNLMAFRNYVLMAPFCSFLIFALLQVYFYCRYGNEIMASSLAIGDAIYNSRWYDVGTKERKYLLMILTRSLRPCKFTAYGFLVINMRAFTRILSTSWSYFALLNQIYYQ